MITVTGGEPPGAGSSGPHGVRARRDVAHADASAPPLPRAGAFAPGPLASETRLTYVHVMWLPVGWNGI